MTDSLEAAIITRTWRVPLPPVSPGDGAAAARQLDAVLLGVGFKLSRDLMGRLAATTPGDVLDIGVRVINAVRVAVGDHVQHNTYFRDFPFGVPDTMEFWVASLRQALLDPVAARNVEAGFIRLPSGGTGTSMADAKDDGDKVVLGWLNLLSLPNYGTYQHTFEEMLAAHGELVPHAGNRVTVLHAGGTLEQETAALYLSLAGSTVPLSEEDRGLLAVLAGECADGRQPEKIPVRENRAIINSILLARRKPILAATVTDVLRLAAAVSDGDVTLETPTRFRSFTRPERRILLAALDHIIAADRARLADVRQHREQWKRLGERLHPHEHPYPPAREVFDVARGDTYAQSIAALAEVNFRSRDAAQAAKALSLAPGMLWRSADRLLRSAVNGDLDDIMDALGQSATRVSGRVLLSVREHLTNRLQPTDVSRVFANRKGRAWVTADDRKPLDLGAVERLTEIIDGEITYRLPDYGRVLIDPAMTGVALPLSGKATAPGLGVMPRGSVSVVTGDTLRFFVYWKQREHRTDYDLSALMLDQHYGNPEHVSWTRYHAGEYATYSGDITDAPNGATEFIDIQLPKVTRQLIIPQVHIYSGEPFDQAAAAFFGFMTRDQAQKGAPFEPRTVRMKSDLRGAGNAALPMAFIRGEDGRWRAKWLHLYLKGRASFNTTEGNRVTTALLTRSIIERDYLRVGYLAGLLGAESWDGTFPAEPVTLIALERPDGLPDGSRVFTLGNLAELIPE